MRDAIILPVAKDPTAALSPTATSWWMAGWRRRTGSVISRPP